MKKSSDEAKLLKRGGYLFALAIMAEVIRVRNGATYLSSIKEDRITSSRGKERLSKYADYAVSLYVQAIEDEMSVQEKEVTTLIRTKDSFDKVIKRARRQYERDAMNKEWLKGTLPKLNT